MLFDRVGASAACRELPAELTLTIGGRFVFIWTYFSEIIKATFALYQGKNFLDRDLTICFCGHRIAILGFR
jgi:hypothetical protein